MEMSSGWKPPPAAGASSATITTGLPQANAAAVNRAIHTLVADSLESVAE
jgi:hypothetical protein